MKKSATYRTITVAIGILVAVVIAVTVWIRMPGETSITGTSPEPQALISKAAKKLMDSTLQLFSDSGFSK